MRDQQNDEREKLNNKSRQADRTGNEDEEFPGYPHYPAKEDIMSSSSEMERVELDVENLSPSGKFIDAANDRNPLSNSPAADIVSSTDEDDITLTPGNESDVTKDDLLVLGGTRFSDNDLQGITRTKVVDDIDLDIPGAELDNQNEEIGEEDEENNYYSLGGDRHENLEEDPTAL